MTERVKHQWNADRPFDGPIIITIYKQDTFTERVRGFVKPRRYFDVPSAQVGGLLYEPVPVKLRSNERVEVHEHGELIMKG